MRTRNASPVINKLCDRGPSKLTFVDWVKNIVPWTRKESNKKIP